MSQPLVDQFAALPSSRSVDASHFVQFYEQDSNLLDSLSGFIAGGLREDDRCIVIATQSHRDGLDARLTAGGLNTGGVREGGRVITLDAAETLETFMANGVPDRQRFTQVIGTLIAELAGQGHRVRLFGEMVALLLADGKDKAAAELEELWNELGQVHSFSLFCAYPLHGFRDAAHTAAFSRICTLHSHVVPAESFPGAAELSQRFRAIAVLQQKALALESEVAERRRIQQRLAQRERELSDFVENAVIGLHKVGPDGTILWANKAELDLLGYSAQEYVGQHIANFHLDSAVIGDILARLRRGEALQDYPARLRAKDGSTKHVFIHSNACFEGDAFSYTRCFTKDVTERKRAEEDREQLLKQLEAERRQLKAAHAALTDKINDLEQFQDCVVGRELKMMELQKEVDALKSRLRQLGQTA